MASERQTRIGAEAEERARIEALSPEERSAYEEAQAAARRARLRAASTMFGAMLMTGGY